MPTGETGRPSRPDDRSARPGGRSAIVADRGSAPSVGAPAPFVEWPRSHPTGRAPRRPTRRPDVRPVQHLRLRGPGGAGLSGPHRRRRRADPAGAVRPEVGDGKRFRGTRERGRDAAGGELDAPGPDRIRTFLLDGPLHYEWRFLPTRANGQLAFGTYHLDTDGDRYVPGGLDVTTVRDGRVAEVVAFLDADLTRFGLPSTIANATSTVA